MKRFSKVLVVALIFTVVLAGCGRSVEKDLVGSWKMTQEGEANRYLEFSKDQLVMINSGDEKKETVAYKVKDMKKDKFSIEIAEQGTDNYTFFIEGLFESDEKIKVTESKETGDKTFNLVKVKDIKKEIKKDQKEREKLAAEEEQKLADEEAEKERLEEEAKKETEQAVEKEETVKEKGEEPSGTTEENTPSEETEVEEDQPAVEEPLAEQGLQDRYLMKVDLIREKMISDSIAEQPDAEGPTPGFSARYAGEWDALLSEVLGLLQETMPANEYEAVSANQTNWLQEKEANYAKYQSGDLQEGWTAEDMIAEDTSARVIHLIENYLQ